MPEQQVLIRPGMDENIDERSLPIGTPRVLVNTRARQGNRFEQRPGQQALVASGLPASGQACWLGSYNDVPVAGMSETDVTGRAENGVYVYNGDRWAYLGRHGHCVPHRRFTVAGRTNTTAYSDESVVAVNGLLYACFNDESGALDTVTVLELTPEGTPIRAVQLTDEDSPRLVWTSSVLLLVTNASGTVKVRTVNLDTFALGSATSLPVAPQASTTMVDAAPVDGADAWLATYASTQTGLYVARLNASHTVTFGTVVLCGTTPEKYTVAGQLDEKIVAAYVDGSDAKATIFNYSLGSPSGITLQTVSGDLTWVQQIGLARTAADRYHAVLGARDASASAPDLTTGTAYHVTIDATAATATQQSTLQHVIPGSKPVRVGADGDASVYAWYHNGFGDWVDAFQSRHVLVKVEGTASPDLGFGPALASVSYEHQARQSGTGSIGACADLGDGRFAALLNWNDPGKFAGLDCAVFSLSTPTTSIYHAQRQIENSGRALLISGGILSDVGDAVKELPSASDAGSLLPENNFAHPPLVMAAVASGGNMTAGKAYDYLACYRQIDGQGRVQRSPGVKLATGIVATGVHRRATVYVTTLGLTNRQRLPGAKVEAELYRSWDGGPYYYAQTVALASAGTETSVVDAASDTSLIDDDGAFDDVGPQAVPPSGARLIKQWGVRMATVGWRENEVQVSKTYRSDTSWEFVDEPQFRVPVPEPITALGELDGVGVIFTSGKIYVVTGDGPDDNGIGSFADARPLPVSAGADSPHVVETPAGLMYYGGGTIWLLPRGFGPPIPVGDLIQKTLRAYPHLRGAVRCVNAEYDLTHFLLANGDLPASGTLVAVWDNKLQAWSRDQLACNIGAIGSAGGLFHALLSTWSALSNQPVRKLEGSTADLNNSGSEVFPEMRIGFGDFRPWGPLGWGRLDRFQIHGEVMGSCALNVVAVTDGVTGLSSNYAIAVGHTTLATKNMTGLGQFYTENQTRYPPGGAYRFDIYSSSPTGTSSGLAIHGVAFSASEPEGLRRMSDAERF